MKKLIGLLSLSLFSAPLLALAQPAAGGCTSVGGAGTGAVNIQKIVCTIGNIFDLVIPILIVLGVLYFVWGVITYVIYSDEEAKKKGRDRMIFGIIGLLVIVAVWGLVGIVNRTFGTGAGTAPTPLPPFPF